MEFWNNLKLLLKPETKAYCHRCGKNKAINYKGHLICKECIINKDKYFDAYCKEALTPQKEIKYSSGEEWFERKLK